MAQIESEPRKVQLVVKDEGQYLLDGLPVELSELGGRLRALNALNIELHVTGSHRVKYDHVAQAMKVVRDEGLERLRFNGGASPTGAR